MKLRFAAVAVALTVVAAPAVVVASNHDPIQPLPPSAIPAIDGSNHNPADPTANQAGHAEKRFLPDTYLDHMGGDLSQFPGQDRPNPRDISNHVFAQDPDPVLNPLDTNNLLWQFGQFLDHDFGITNDVAPDEPMNMVVPPNDPFFDPVLRPFLTINRQVHDPSTGIAPAPNPRLSINTQTGWIDTSQVYGYGQTLPGPGAGGPTPGVLREFSGGRLIVEPGTNLLPRVPTVLPTPLFPSTLFVCGDFFPRCNETPGLTMMHTLFVREHNRKVAEYAAQNPTLTDEQLFQLGRRWVMSLMQSITVNEFIPALTGEKVPPYDGYKPEVNGRLALEFVHSLYRLGHTLVPRELQRYGSPGGHNQLPSLDLGESLFQSPNIFQTSADLDALMRGFIRQPHEKLDCVVADGLRNTLVVDEPGEAGTLFDLPAINIERGRELGLPSYNQARVGFGLPPAAHFSDTFDAKAAGRLSSIYANTDQIDLFAGGICETAAHPSQGHTGPLITAVIMRQIQDLRAADRFWYENVLTKDQIKEVERYKLSDLILNNTGLQRDEINHNAFKAKH
ncbi:MAG TPA: peroxidase family protein [Thermoanaerobaculia bacterium]